MVPTSQTLKTNNLPRFQVNDWLVMRPNVIVSDCFSQVPFQQRSFADMSIHLRIEEAVLQMGISGARKCNVGAPEEFIYGHVSSARLRYSYVCTDTVKFYPDLNFLLDGVNY